MIIECGIYDFDGPINDSFREGLRRIEVLCGLNKVPFNRETRQRLIRLWGKPGAELLERGLGVSRKLAKKIYREWEIYDLIYPIPLIPGSRETLSYARKNGIKNALLTSRNRRNIYDIFEKLDLAREFDVISTRQDCRFKKPDPRVFQFILGQLKRKFGITKDRCIFVGDTPEDITCGLAAEIETLVVLTGPYWVEDIQKFPIKPGNILPSIDYLPEWLVKHRD